MCNECVDRNGRARLALCLASAALTDLFAALSAIDLTCVRAPGCFNHFEMDQKLLELLLIESIKAGKDGQNTVGNAPKFGESSVLVGDDLNDILDSWLKDFAGGKK